MNDHTTNGYEDRTERPIVQEPDLRRTVRHVGRILGVMSLGCELVLELREPTPSEEEG